MPDRRLGGGGDRSRFRTRVLLAVGCRDGERVCAKSASVCGGWWALCRRPCVSTDPIGPRTPVAQRPRAARAAIVGPGSACESISPAGSLVRADPVGRQQLQEQAMRAFVGELRATSRTSVAVATPPIPAPATTAPGASSGQRRRLSSCSARVAVIAVGLAAVVAFALIALTPNAAAPIRDIRAVALELPAPRAARPASVGERAVRRSVRPRRAPAARKPRRSRARARQAARGPATARPVSTTAPPASSLAGARSSPGALPRTSAPFTAAPSSASEFLP